MIAETATGIAANEIKLAENANDIAVLSDHLAHHEEKIEAQASVIELRENEIKAVGKRVSSLENTQDHFREMSGKSFCSFLFYSEICHERLS